MNVLSAAIVATFPLNTSITGNATVTASPLGNPAALFSWGGYFQALGLLFFIMACLWAALWYLKRRGGLRLLGMQEGFSLEKRMSLGPKKNLVIVRLENKRLLLGVTEQTINLLMELPVDSADTAIPESANGTDTGGTSSLFTTLLNKHMREHNE